MSNHISRFPLYFFKNARNLQKTTYAILNHNILSVFYKEQVGLAIRSTRWDMPFCSRDHQNDIAHYISGRSFHKTVSVSLFLVFRSTTFYWFMRFNSSYVVWYFSSVLHFLRLYEFLFSWCRTHPNNVHLEKNERRFHLKTLRKYYVPQTLS